MLLCRRRQQGQSIVLKRVLIKILLELSIKGQSRLWKIPKIIGIIKERVS